MAENGNGKRASMQLPDDLRYQSKSDRPDVMLDVTAHEHRSWFWAIVVVVLIVGVGVAALIILPKIVNRQDAASASATAKANNRPAPVTVATAHLGLMNLYLNGLGSVTALNTVTVHTRVTGQLMKVGYTEGQHVVANQTLIAQVDPRPYQAALDQAKGALVKDQANLDLAKANVARDANAMKTSPGAVSQQQYDTDQSSVAQLIGTVQSDQANIEADQVQLDYCTINAPISGVIGLRLVDPGNIVQPTDTTGLAVISQLQPISVVFTFSEDVLPQVLARQKTGVPIEVDAYDRDMTNVLSHGTLLAVDSAIDPTTGTIKLKAIFKNTDEMLYPNQFVNARLLIDTRKGAVIVPSAAVQRGPNSTYVYVVNSDDTVTMRTITTGPSENDQTIITSGVFAGEKVVTDGVDSLTDGKKVQPVAATDKGNPTTNATTAPSIDKVGGPGSGFSEGSGDQAPGAAADQAAAGAGGAAGESANATSQPADGSGDVQGAAGEHHHHHHHADADATSQPSDSE
jgi:membrane fusion protein, multidrug efflux system